MENVNIQKSCGAVVINDVVVNCAVYRKAETIDNFFKNNLLAEGLK